MNILVISILLLLFLVTFYKAHRNTHKVMVNYIDLTNGQKEPLPGPHLNILQLSDMHLEKISISPEQLYNKLAVEKIDLIALTGDFLDKKRSIPELGPYLKVLNKLNPTYGIYAIFGNHDYKLKEKDFQKLKDELEVHGCITLQNENTEIFVEGRRVNIIGIDDFHSGKSNLISSYSSLKDGYDLVLTHDPNIVLHMEDFHFDYLLSGHFHGGQIHWPKPYHLAKLGPTFMKLNMIKGLQQYHNKPFYINEGLGQTSINVRVGSRPEITFHKVAVQHSSKNKLAAV